MNREVGIQTRDELRLIEIPDTRLESFASEAHDEDEEHEEHEPYAEETIKRAIAGGVEPDGERLEWPTTRWSMSDENLDDLVEFLKALE
jgi:hypothetical protein